MKGNFVIFIDSTNIRVNSDANKNQDNQEQSIECLK